MWLNQEKNDENLGNLKKIIFQLRKCWIICFSSKGAVDVIRYKNVLVLFLALLKIKVMQVVDEKKKKKYC